MMKRLLAIAMMVLATCNFAAAGEVPELKRAILMAYYGTLDDSARAYSYDCLSARVRAAFPGVEVREAYTSRSTAAAMQRRLGTPHLLLAQALQQLERDGYNSVVVCTTELMRGRTAFLMERCLDELRPQFFELKLTTPLLYTAADCRQVMDIMAASVQPLHDGEQVVFISHGKNGADDDVFCLADYILQHEGHPNMHVGTVEGYPGLEQVKAILRQSGATRVLLAPLMITGGGHAKRNVQRVWREALEAEGYTVRVTTTGMGELEAIQQLWIEKINQALLMP